jgi:hypothetical protein
VESQSALGRTSRDVVLDAVALEDLDRAVVTIHREADRVLALRDAEHGAKAGVERDVIGSGVELAERSCQRAGAGSGGRRGRRLDLEHRTSPGRVLGG